MQAKYQIDTTENRKFLRDNAENILSFGHRFPSPGGHSLAIPEAKSWRTQPLRAFAASSMTL